MPARRRATMVGENGSPGSVGIAAFGIEWAEGEQRKRKNRKKEKKGEENKNRKAGLQDNLENLGEREGQHALRLYIYNTGVSLRPNNNNFVSSRDKPHVDARPLPSGINSVALNVPRSFEMPCCIDASHIGCTHGVGLDAKPSL